MSVQGVTDDDGTVFLSVKGVPAIFASKEGYYWSRATKLSGKFPNPIFSLNRPDITMTLLRKQRPVPMYVHSVDSKIPKLNEPVGFDLIAGDWVEPNGTGKISDLIFNIDFTEHAEHDWDQKTKITFTNPDDGIQLRSVPGATSHLGQPSELRLPREAPEDGYLNELIWSEYVHAGLERRKELKKHPGQVRPILQQTHGDENDNYIFRVRSRRGVDGKIQAMYGKIHGELSTLERTVKFLYYLNPDGTCSLEWDMSNNLFPHEKTTKDP